MRKNKKLLRIGYLAACCFVLSSMGCVRHDRSVRVGDYEISGSDAQYRDAVIRQYYPGDNRNLGLSQLIRAYTYAQILKNHGQEVTSATLQREADRIDRNTKAPEALGRIKAVFGKDYNAYLRVFVLPSYVQHALYYDFFLRDEGVQSSAKENAEHLLKISLESENKFESLAQSYGLSIAHFSISPQNEMTWRLNDVGEPPSPGHVPQAHEAIQPTTESKADPVMTELRTLETGQVFSHLIERPENWMIVKKTGERKGLAEFSSISVPKADFDEWLSSESRKIRIIAPG